MNKKYRKKIRLSGEHSEYAKQSVNQHMLWHVRVINNTNGFAM